MKKIYLLLSILILMISCQKADEFIENSNENETQIESRSTRPIRLKSRQSPSNQFDCASSQSYLSGHKIDLYFDVFTEKIGVPGYVLDGLYLYFSSSSAVFPGKGAAYYYSTTHPVGSVNIENAHKFIINTEITNSIILNADNLPKGKFLINGFLRYRDCSDSNRFIDIPSNTVLVTNNSYGLKNGRLLVSIPDDGRSYLIKFPAAQTSFIAKKTVPIINFDVELNQDYTIDVIIYQCAPVNPEIKTVQIEIPRTQAGELVEVSCSWD